MYPNLFNIGDFPITSFGLMMFLSFVGGAWVLGKMMKRYGFTSELAWDMLAWIAIGGVLGAKALLPRPAFDQVMAEPDGDMISRAGLVWYGGLIGGVTAYYFQIRSRKLPLAVMYDATAPALIWPTRLGAWVVSCVGDDYGEYTTGLTASRFRRDRHPRVPVTSRAVRKYNSRSQFPIQRLCGCTRPSCYEIGSRSIMFAILWRLANKRSRPGQLFACFMSAVRRRALRDRVRARQERPLPVRTHDIAGDEHSC